MRAHRLLPGILALALTAPLAAQTVDTRPRAFAGFEYYSVSFGAGIGTKTVTEMVVPLGLIVPVGRRLTFDAGTSYVSAERTDEAGGSTSLNSLTDLVVRAGWQIIPDALIFTLAANLPTGTATLEGDQIFLAGAVATDLIPFPVTSFGSGFNVTTGLALAQPVGSWALGVAGSYRYNGSYEPLADTSVSLTPGAEYRVRIGADRLVGQGRLSLGFTFSTFSRDEFGADQYSPGKRFISQASWSLPLGTNRSLALYVWDIHRTVDSTTSYAGAQKENTISTGVIGSFRIGRNTLRPSVELRHQWAGVSSLEDYGTQVGLGARLAIPAGQRFTVTPSVRLDLGSLVNGASNVSYTGVSAGVSVRANL